MILRNITDTMSDIVYGKLSNHQKINIFSGHDLTVAALLAVVGDLDPHIPKYSATVMVELLQKNDNYYVKVNLLKLNLINYRTNLFYLRRCIFSFPVALLSGNPTDCRGFKNTRM